jgi:hypothetical protein
MVTVVRFHNRCVPFNVDYPATAHSDSLSLSNMAFPSEDGILDISPPQCSLSDDLDDAFCCDRNLRLFPMPLCAVL